MPGDIQLQTLTHLSEARGKALSAVLFADNGTSDLQIEMSDENADIKLSDGSRVAKLEMDQDGQLRQILVNDQVIWPS